MLMANPDVVKAVCIIDHQRIDVINILEATMEAMEAGAYTRPLFSSTFTVSDTKYTLNTP